jgi:hypothetical protein
MRDTVNDQQVGVDRTVHHKIKGLEKSGPFG